MEFYRSVDVGLSDEMRFNSQRDGILRICIVFVLLAISAVSIPNGMEFYKQMRVIGKPPGVSIPNGMEFYSTNFAIFLGRKC